MLTIHCTCPKCGQFEFQHRDLRDGETGRQYCDLAARVISEHHLRRSLLCDGVVVFRCSMPENTKAE